MSDHTPLLGPVVVSTTETAFVSTSNEVTMTDADDIPMSMAGLAEALPSNSILMRMPNEVLAEIARHCVTPFDDMESLWRDRTDSDIKVLARVNRRFYDICRTLRLLSHVRLWAPEQVLRARLREVNNPHYLSTCRSLSIRTIGPLQNMHPPQTAMAFVRPLAGSLFRDLLRNTIRLATKLTELRLATDNGGRSIEPILIRILRPGDITFPNIKSLYLRTETSMASTFRCFPNLKAINLNIHCGVTRSAEIATLTSMRSLRVLAILKHGRGWVVDDLSRHLPQRFQQVESLALEGFINMARYSHVPVKVNAVVSDDSLDHFEKWLLTISDDKEMAEHITSGNAWPALKKLVISDEPYIHLPGSILTTPTYFDLARSKCLPREEVAIAFFKKLPSLREIVIGRKCDFSAHVYEPIVREPAENGHTDDQNLTPERNVGARLVKVYKPRDRTNVGYQYVSRPGNAKWGQPYQAHGHPNEYVPLGREDADGRDDEDRLGAAEWYYYPEMRLQNAQTTFFDAEWLATIRDKKF